VICLKCLEKDARRRYPSAGALADDLRRFQRGEAISARPAGSLERMSRWLRRRKVPVALFAIGALLGVGLVAAGMSLWSKRQAEIGRAKEQVRRERLLLEQAENIHLKRATHAEGRSNAAAERRFNKAQADREYEAAFRDAGFGAVGGDPKTVS